jgi:hypothetical protein
MATFIILVTLPFAKKLALDRTLVDPKSLQRLPNRPSADWGHIAQPTKSNLPSNGYLQASELGTIRLAAFRCPLLQPAAALIQVIVDTAAPVQKLSRLTFVGNHEKS